MASSTSTHPADDMEFLNAEPLELLRREFLDGPGSIASPTIIDLRRESLGSTPRNTRLVTAPVDEEPPLSFQETGDGYGENSDESSDDGDVKKARHSTERNRRTRELYARRHARAMAIFLALAALSGGVTCLVLREDVGGPAFELLPDFLGRYFGLGEEKEGKGERRLALGSGVVGTVPNGGGVGAVNTIRVSRWTQNRKAQAEAQAMSDHLNKRARRDERTRADRLIARARREPATIRGQAVESLKGHYHEGHYHARGEQGLPAQEQEFFVPQG